MLKVFLAVLTNYLFHTSLLLEVVILSLVQPIFRIPVLLVVHVFTDIQNTEQQMWTESHKNSNRKLNQSSLVTRERKDV